MAGTSPGVYDCGMLIVGTTSHLEDLDREYTLATDVSVNAVASAPTGAFGMGGSAAWALLDGERVDRLDEVDLAPVASLPTPSGQSMAAVANGDLLVGLADAHLVTVSSSGAVTPVPSFDTVEGRTGWDNPAGPTPDLRSIAVSDGGSWFAGVHVGGVWRSRDAGATWESVVAPELDVHELGCGGERRVVAAASAGFGWSEDDGDTWQWTTDGLHSAYARAVALDGDTVFLTASTGPETNDGRLFRAPIGGSFVQCRGGLPESFPFNLDTATVTARAGQVALGTPDGRVFRSRDSGEHWELACAGMPPVRVLRFA